jgi:hypothetical protein
MQVDSEDRVLLIVSNVSHNVRKWQWLYRWLDENSIRLGSNMMRSHYRKISTLKGGQATRLAFVTRLRTLGREKGTLALDVILNVHGRPDALKFADGWVKVPDLAAEVERLGLGHRFRLLYSTCCYGALHAQAFTDAGFSAASGSRKVNTNGTFDFPTQLDRWRGGHTYADAVEAGNQPQMLAVHDGLAKAFGFPDSDSRKLLCGDGTITITSPAQVRAGAGP